MSTPDREEDFRLAGDDPMMDQVERVTATRAEAAAEASRPEAGQASGQAGTSGGQAGTSGGQAGADAEEPVGADGVIPADPFEPDASQ